MFLHLHTRRWNISPGWLRIMQKKWDRKKLTGMLDGSIMGQGRAGVSTPPLQRRPSDVGFKEADEGWRSGSPPSQAQMSEKKEVCDRGILEQGGRARERRGEADGGRTGMRWREGWRRRRQHLQTSLAGESIKSSGQRRADNSALSIRFNPLKDLNVHLV